MRKRWLLVLVAGAVIAIVVRTIRRSADASGDVVPSEPRPRERLVDRASEESFPASDPPSYWGRDAE